jgi:uncharacterized protein DUF1549/uncharacterized protein DUF1553/cytochrome c
VSWKRVDKFRKRRRAALGRSIPFLIIMLAMGVDPARAGEPALSARVFAAEVKPILARSCLRCHGEDMQRSGLDLREEASIRKGGKRGPAIVPGKPEESRLVLFVKPDSMPHMPPGKEQLAPEELIALKRWIAAAAGAGASPDSAAGGSPASEPAGGKKSGDAAAVHPPAWLAPPGLPPELVIDLALEAGWRARGVAPALPVDDEGFLRRISLDLIGRIPTRAEREAFRRSTRSDKRQALCESLLASPEHPRRLREVFDAVLLGRGDEKARAERKKNGWYRYLDRAFAANRPWDAMARDLLLARGAEEDDRGAAWFLYERKEDHQAMAEAMAPALLGLRIECAQCHNHPLASEIEQRHYWGLVAFLNRTRNVSTRKGPAVGESAIGGFIKFKTLKGESRDALLTFLDGKTLDEERPAEGVKEVDAPERYRVPPPAKDQPAEAAAVPRDSRREKLADLLGSGSPYLARAAVNRMWALLLGRGLVQPVDRMDSAHPPSHPELLDWLAEDFRSHGHDLRRLVRGIVRSRAYQLDSRPAAPAGERPPPESFALGPEKPLTAETMHRSLVVALEAGPIPEETPQVFHELFPDDFPPEPAATLKQALFYTNDAAIEDLLRPRPGGLVERLAGLADPRTRIAEAFEAFLGRPPAGDELERFLEHFRARADRPEAAIRGLVWALLASAEFELNH